MEEFKVFFKICEELNCPLYDVGERLGLSEKTLSCPKGKEVCLILVRDMTQLLFQFLKDSPVDLQPYLKTQFNCSGCTGLIKFLITSADASLQGNSGEGASANIDAAVKKMYGKIIDSPLVREIPQDKVELVLEKFKEIHVQKDSVLIRKGEQNLNIYIVLEGELKVEDGGVVLADLMEGDICGEMSYLGADLAVSTVIASKKTTVLAIEGDVFGHLLGDCVAVQKFMARLLAKRLSMNNTARAREFESCMSGRIDEIVPAELFQIFHMHQKTGVLQMELPNGCGKVSFREGCMINASYNDAENQEAVFEILAEKKGVYRFTTGLSPQEMKAAEIGDFMMLLMEGVKRVDEEQQGN